ncbi:hypothetical protein [Nakamurella sp.]|uniref:hypothetical protein n=1 Tax=Nakamurella sp. TaxID=1869182 RepID=UPI003B3BCC27
MAALTVDLGARTISGLAVPYGPVGVDARRRRRYQRDCLRWLARVPLLEEHVQSARVGWTLRLVDIPAGLLALFAVDRGRRGDRALAAAAEGWLGLSVGVDVVEAGPDPADASVQLVALAYLTEVSLTRTPIFGGSR